MALTARVIQIGLWPCFVRLLAFRSCGSDRSGHPNRPVALSCPALTPWVIRGRLAFCHGSDRSGHPNRPVASGLDQMSTRRLLTEEPTDDYYYVSPMTPPISNYEEMCRRHSFWSLHAITIYSLAERNHKPLASASPNSHQAHCHQSQQPLAPCKQTSVY